MKIQRIDHLVLTVRSIEKTVEFYSQVLKMEVVTFNFRYALKFGEQKINLHLAGQEFTPHALQPVPGSADFCLISDEPLEAWQSHLSALNIQVEEGPVLKTGAWGPMQSLYIRDPDQNLVEISHYSSAVFSSSGRVGWLP